MTRAFVTALALLCLGTAFAATAWSRRRLAVARRRAEDLVRALDSDETCETAREVQ